MNKGLLTKDEIKKCRILIDDLTNQMTRSGTPPEKRLELKRQIRNIRSELWQHKNSKPKKAADTFETGYRGAE